MSTVEAKLKELGHELPELAAPAGSYVPFVRTGNLLVVSGQIPFDAEGNVITGQVAVDLDVEEARAAACRCGLALIAVARSALPSLDHVVRVVRLGGFVNAGPGFASHPAVVNGCSDLMNAVWGDAGRHARAAVGVSGLPANAAVEVDAVFEVR